MANLNAKIFTLNVSKDIEKALRILRKLVSENSNIVEPLETQQIFYVHDLTHPNFFFYINDPERDEDEKHTIFNVTYKPESQDSLSHRIRSAWTDDIEDIFNEWIELIKEFNEISFTEEETFTKFYEEEIFDDFKIVDDDAETHPFNNLQQIILYKFLSSTIFYLENKHPDDIVIKNICSESVELRDNIQNLTKKDFSKKFSKILAKIKKYSFQTFIEISDVAKKEIYKFLLNEGIKKLPHWIDNIHTFFITHN